MLTDKRLFLFDIDGTLCRGDTWIEGARELLTILKEQQREYVLLTNNSTKSREDYFRKFSAMGLELEENEIMTASMAAGLYISENCPERKIYALGTASFREEMRAYGLDIREDPGEADCLLTAYDSELTYEKLRSACHLLNRSGILYLATNPDLVCPDEEGFVPDCGSICEMLEHACGKRPRFIGKPDPFMARYAVRSRGMHKSQAVLVGDRMYTDILCGVHAGIDTIGVLTGEMKEQDLRGYDYRPTYLYASVAELAEEFGTLTEIIRSAS